LNEMRRIEPEAEPSKREAPPKARVRAMWFVIPGVVLAAALGWGAYGHWRSNGEAADAQKAAEDFTPTVRVAEARREDGPVKLQLPGATQAFDSATMYARATGYIVERRVDIGTRVHKGDSLARIAAPDLDQQLAQATAQLSQTGAALLQAQANLRQAQSNRGLADVTNRRIATLATQGWETKQNADNTQAGLTARGAEVETADAGVHVAEANFAAQEASVRRYQQLTDYENVAAPFDGVVTERNVDVGDLVSTDSTSGTSLFTVTKDDVLRVRLFVPQSSAIGVRPGLDARVTVPELPGRVFAAKVARTAAALDPASRTMLTEVDVPNSDGTLRAGLYATVAIDVPRDAPGVVVPSNAILFNASGLQVAVIKDDQAKLRKVTIYRDFGETIELRDGLQGGEQIALEPPADLADGARVKVAKPEDGKQAPQGGKA